MKDSISDSNSSKSDSSSMFSILKSSDEFMPSGESLHSSDLDKVSSGNVLLCNTHRGLHSTEVAYLLLTEQPRV